MAISYVSASQNSDGSTGSVTVTKPSGVVSGHVMLAFVAQNEQTITASGWTQIIQESGSADTFSGTMFYKVAGGSEPADYTFSVGTSGAPIAVGIVAFSGVDNANPIHASTSSWSGDEAEPDSGISLTTSISSRRVVARCARSTSSIITFSTATSGWTERCDTGAFSGGTVRYSVGVFTRDSDDSGSSLATPAVTASDTDTSTIWLHLALKPEVATNAPATVASATATAYAPASLTATTTSAYAAATATAHDATVLTGVAAENTGYAAVTATAYDAMGWVIHPVDIGAVAFDATVEIGTQAEVAAVSVGAHDAVGYYGAPESRRWTIPAEDRSWTIAAESRAWTIPSED